MLLVLAGGIVALLNHQEEMARIILERERQSQIFILLLQKRLEVSLQKQLYLRTHFMLLLLQRMQALLLWVFMIHIIRTRRRLERLQTFTIRIGMK